MDEMREIMCYAGDVEIYTGQLLVFKADIPPRHAQ